MLDKINRIINETDNFLWGRFMIILLLGTHLFMTVRTKFMQRKIFTAIKLSVTKEPEFSGDISPFQSLATALASTIGTGNIIGVGTAVALGGPGAVLWCWIAGIFGIATKYAESLLAVKFRIKTKDGRMLGGAMYTLERGLRRKQFGVLFAIFTLLASFGIGSGVQVNAIASIFKQTFDPNNLLIITVHGKSYSVISIIAGISAAVVTACIIFGGIKSISKVCELFVPAMAALYVLGCIIILIINHSFVPAAVILIVKSAFTSRATVGGFVGYSVMSAARYGIARGLFSNESGMGSAPIVACAAQSRNAVRQGLISSTGTFWDTVIVCLLSGLVVVSSMLDSPDAFIGIKGEQITFTAFRRIPYIGTPILLIGIVLFAYSTILGWSYYGERCVEYLFGRNGMIPYKLVFIFVILASPVISLDIVWSLADIFNALMALPNLAAVICLSGIVAKDTKYYLYENHLDEFDSAKGF